jgi:hypothetical protein
MRTLRSIGLAAVVLLGIGCGSDQPGTDVGPNPDRGIFEGPVTKKDPDQGPTPDWVLLLREAGLREAGLREAAAPKDAAPKDALHVQ